MDWRAAPYRATMAFYDCDDWDVRTQMSQSCTGFIGRPEEPTLANSLRYGGYSPYRATTARNNNEVISAESIQEIFNDVESDYNGAVTEEFIRTIGVAKLPTVFKKGNGDLANSLGLAFAPCRVALTPGPLRP